MALAANAAASDSSMDRSTLKGINAIKVVVDAPSPEIEREGISADGLRVTMEKKLREAGINVDHNAVEFLGLNISSARAPRKVSLLSKGTVSIVVNLGLYQVVLLDRDKTTKTVTETWGDQRVAPASPKAIERAVTDAVDDLVEEFITAYRSVNPHQ